jgi:hypothetical protein
LENANTYNRDVSLSTSTTTAPRARDTSSSQKSARSLDWYGGRTHNLIAWTVGSIGSIITLLKDQRAEHWVLLSSAMELSNLTDWDIVSESSNPLDLSSMLYVLAMRADNAPLLLLRGKCSGSRRLLLASTFDGNIYQLGDGSFYEQIRRVTSGEVAFDGSKFSVYPEELYLMVHGYISLESIADIQACQCWSGN